MGTLSNAYPRLIAAISRLYSRQIPPTLEAGEMLRNSSRALEQVVSLERDLLPRRLPACRHLAYVAALAQGPAIQDIVQAFVQVEPHLVWRQNPNYSARNLGATFMENYAYCEFVGLQGPAGDGSIAVGVLLLSPGQLYPDHYHAAAEIYHVLGGTAQWRHGKAEWSWKPPGSCIYHPAWEAHALRCAKEPLLALYAWQGEVDTPASLIEPGALQP